VFNKCLVTLGTLSEYSKMEMLLQFEECSSQSWIDVVPLPIWSPLCSSEEKMFREHKVITIVVMAFLWFH